MLPFQPFIVLLVFTVSQPAAAVSTGTAGTAAFALGGGRDSEAARVSPWAELKDVRKRGARLAQQGNNSSGRPHHNILAPLFSVFPPPERGGAVEIMVLKF